METLKQQVEEKKSGVLSGHRPEKGYWRLEVKWKDGKTTTSNFPATGFDVFDTNGENGKFVGHATAKEIEEFLNKHAGEYESPDANGEKFSWKLLFEKKK